MLAGKSFCITGTLRISRVEVEGIIKKYGGKFHSSVCSYTNYLVVGTKPGATKLRAARNLSVPILYEEDFWAMFPETARPAPLEVELGLSPGIPRRRAEIGETVQTAGAGSVMTGRKMSWDD